MYVHVIEDDRVQTLPGRSVEAQKNVENVSVSSFQTVAFEEDGWRRRCRRPFRPSRKDRSVARSPNSELFRTNGGKFVSFLPDEEAGPARPSLIRRLGAVWRRLHSSHAPRLVSAADVRRDERILLEIRDQDLWAKGLLYHRSCYQSYTSPSTLKKAGGERAWRGSCGSKWECAQKSICLPMRFYYREHPAYGKRHWHISALH